MKRVILAVVLLCSFAAAVAQEVPEAERPSREDIAKFFETMKLKTQMEGVYSSIGQQVDGMIQQEVQRTGHEMTPEERAKFQDFMRWTLQRTREMYPISEMLDDMIPVYQRYLSREDLAATVAFYSSPSGQRMLDRMPQMMGAAMQAIMPKMQDRMGKLQVEMQAKLKELMPETHGGPAKPVSGTSAGASAKKPAPAAKAPATKK